MSSADPLHDVQIVVGDLSKSDHERLLRILFSDSPACPGRGAGDLDVTRDNRRHGQDGASSSTVHRGSVNSAEPGASQVVSTDNRASAPARPGSVCKGVA